MCFIIEGEEEEEAALSRDSEVTHITMDCPVTAGVTGLALV